MQDKKTWLTVSILKFTPDRPTRVHCTVFNDAFPSPKLSETIKINFKDYMKPKARRFAANETLELKCEDTAETLGRQYKADRHSPEICEGCTHYPFKSHNNAIIKVLCFDCLFHSGLLMATKLEARRKTLWRCCRSMSHMTTPKWNASFMTRKKLNLFSSIISNWILTKVKVKQRQQPQQLPRHCPWRILSLSEIKLAKKVNPEKDR